jgi:hypothetical protein
VLVIPPRQRPAPPVALGAQYAPDTSAVGETPLPRIEVESPPARSVDPPAARLPELAFPDEDSGLVPVTREAPRQEE